ncbi:MAG: alpha-L-arabinofuranosidase domain protein, partial [Paenibacillus sp.]|nr:alpha-L-arabinofuranosidase domain protein [Paenibacillus sp.]
MNLSDWNVVGPMRNSKISLPSQWNQSGDLFGIFFEDLNHAADGELYAELVQNRSFEFDPIDCAEYHALTAWEKIERGGGKVEITVEESNPVFNAIFPNILLL